MAVTYFGFQTTLDTPGSLSYDNGNATITFYNNTANVTYTCPSTGSFDIKELRMFGYGWSGYNIRLAIFDTSGNLMAQGNAAVSPYTQGAVDAASAAWVGHIGAAAITQVTALTGGADYLLAISFDNSNLWTHNATVSNATLYRTATDLTAVGFANPLANFPYTTNYGKKFALICGIEAAGGGASIGGALNVHVRKAL